ncbi:MAG: chemotaxis protein CheX [Proteobacteria bacterium]|jgi:chemotaxis protein CheX|nr:chemotaxis protein CheX [Alphaproteobacteria bacterium]NCC03090.1 chemotaxis protein CheX [Pseudomonadota bacterium]
MGEVLQYLSLDDVLSKEITNAVISAMQTTFNVSVTAGPAEIGRGIVSLVGDVSGVIALVQDGLEGTMTLCLTFETVRDVLPRIVGHSVSVTQEMTVDAVGEITNMIFGQIKTELNRRGYGLKLGIPSVVTGRGHFVSQFHRGPFMLIPFYLEGQLFQVHVALYERKS